jgi:hypothetical protein
VRNIGGWPHTAGTTEATDTAVPPCDVAGALCDDVVASSLNVVVVIIVAIAVSGVVMFDACFYNDY